MIFAELTYKKHYSEIHQELVDFIGSRFSEVQHGLQGDSWIWIFEGDQKVEIDTFSSMTHQIKSPDPESTLVTEVLNCLEAHYRITRYEKPQPEAHEE